MENLPSHAKERYLRLEKRAVWLRNRILDTTHLHKDLTYDKAELGALEWAMRIILAYYQDHQKDMTAK